MTAVISDPLNTTRIKNIHARYHALPFYKKIWFRLTSWSLPTALAHIDPLHTTDDEIKNLAVLIKRSWFYSTVFGVLNGFSELHTSVITQKVKKTEQRHALERELPRINPFLTDVDKAHMRGVGKLWFEYYHMDTLCVKFLEHVVNHDVTQVKKLLSICPDLAVRRGNITDKSGRKFTAITGFQYALFVLDTRFMCPAIIDSLPKDANNKYRIALRDQYQKYKGLHYQLVGIQFGLERHYNFSQIINLLQENSNQFDLRSHQENVSFWVRRIGGAQRLLPAHVVYYYLNTYNNSSDEVFNETLHQREKNIPDKKAAAVFNFSGSKPWFSDDLGVKWAIGRSGGLSAGGMFLVLNTGPGVFILADEQYTTPDKEFHEQYWQDRLRDFDNLAIKLEIQSEHKSESVVQP